MQVPVLRQAERIVPRRSHVRQAAALARIPQKRVPVLRLEYAQQQCALRQLGDEKDWWMFSSTLPQWKCAPSPMGRGLG
jgi:hypothetical protein